MPAKRAKSGAFTAALLIWTALSFSATNAVQAAQPDAKAVSFDRAAAKARSLVRRMSQEEKIGLVTGGWGIRLGDQAPPPGAAGGDGFVKGIPRLGIPDLQLVGAGLGVTNLGQRANGPSTALPSSLAETASFDLDLAYDYGAMIGRQTRAEGFNISLGGAVNLTRDPRGGRAFEYHGEDPVLAGLVVGRELQGTQDQGVVATIKHYALNDLENGRFGIDAQIDEKALRESDLLAFELGLKTSGAGAVMCSYNLVNSVYACENPELLNNILKKEWGFKGWVMSDWGATHSTVAAANAGLDQEFFAGQYFGKSLKRALAANEVPAARLDDMVVRILTPLIAVGAVGRSPATGPIDAEGDGALALRVAEQGSVLLKNDGLLPLNARTLKRIAVIGLHADKGVMSGGGSSQVLPIGGNAVPPSKIPEGILGFAAVPIWVPSAPLAAIRAKAPGADVSYDPGDDIARAAATAKTADVAIVFAGRRRTEGSDVPDLSLGDGQEALIAAVAAANPHTVVVLETGGAVTMPWLRAASSVLEAWYPGQRGGEAIANLLFGNVNPSGKTPLTFPASEADWVRPILPGPPPKAKMELADLMHPERFDVRYDEGAFVGYKWFQSKHKPVLFPFGFGLSYTTFAYARPKAGVAATATVEFDLSNTGPRAGSEVAQVYVDLPETAGEPRRLAGWAKVALRPGETRRVSVALEPRALDVWDVETHRWRRLPGAYRIHVGGSSEDLPLIVEAHVGGTGSR